MYDDYLINDLNLLGAYKLLFKLIYRFQQNLQFGSYVPPYAYTLYDRLLLFIDSCSYYFKRTNQLLNNQYQKNKRLKDTISCMLKKDCLFLTFTFNESSLQFTTFKYRKDYITRFLHSLGFYYVANVDYGSKFGREHYHALVQTDFIDSTVLLEYKLGSINFKHVFSTKSSNLSSYINKLKFHAIKDTTIHKVIYCRNRKLLN